jgi:extracellular matrix regulatory protein B
VFIHLGGDTVIRSKDVIAILDRQVKETSETTGEFLQFYEEENKVEEIAKDMTKSIVVTAEIIYLSPISSSTLKRRALFVSDIDDI